MIHFTDASGLLGSAVAIAAAGSRMPGVSRLTRTRRRWLAAAVMAAALLPVGPLPLAGYLRGAIGDLSITSLILLSGALLHWLYGWVPPPGRDRLLLLVVCMGAGLYPLALGWGGFDPYRLGFGSYWFLACLLALAALAVLARLPMIAFAIALSVLAWSAGWYESTNIWDYLLDPAVSIYAAVAITVQGMRRVRRLRMRDGLQHPR